MRKEIIWIFCKPTVLHMKPSPFVDVVTIVHPPAKVRVADVLDVRVLRDQNRYERRRNMDFLLPNIIECDLEAACACAGFCKGCLGGCTGCSGPKGSK